MPTTRDLGARRPSARPRFAGTERYELLGELGEGGMGIVYEVRDRASGEVRALKTVPDLDPEHLLRLKDEFRAAVDLRHDNLVRLGELVEESGVWFFTMERVDGVPFTDWIAGRVASVKPPTDPTDVTAQDIWSQLTVEREPPASEPAPLDVVRLRGAIHQLAAAVHAIHQHERVHRDLKPSNVLVTPEGRVVVLDFGLATTLGRQREELIAGTIEYMAPEQMLGDAGPPADWYAVGVLLYECLTGTVPFTGELMAVLDAKQRGTVVPPSLLYPDAPVDLEALCLKLLAADPAARPRGEVILDALTPLDPPRVAGLRTVPFVGRRRELDALGEALAGSRAGRAVTVLLEGESGIGKSSIARELAAGCARDDERAIVLAGRCHDRESLPFRAFDGVVDDLSRVLKRIDPEQVAALLPARPEHLARLFPVLARVAPIARAAEAPMTVTPRELRARGFDQLRELFAALGRRGPLVLVVDDLQWIDADSIDLMVHVLAEPDSPGLLLVGTLRPGAAALAERLVARGLAAPAIVRVGALEDDDARALARRAFELAGRTAGASDEVAMDAGGHPGYIRELARADTAATRGAPAALEELLIARIAALPAPQRRLLQILSIATGPLPAAVLAAAGGLDPVVVRRHLAELRDHELVSVQQGKDGELVAPYHDRVRAAQLAAMPADSRRRGHKRLATALARTPGASLEDLHHHWLEAGRRHRAAAYAQRAADAAVERLQFHRAADLYAAAIELGEPLKPSTRATMQIRLGNALGLAGRGGEAAEQLLAASAVVAPELAASLRRTAAEQLMASGHYQRGMEVLRQVLAEADLRYPRGRAGTLVAFVGARLRLRLRGMEPRPAPSAAPATPIARARDAALAASRSLGLVDLVRGSYYQARFLRLALDGGEPGQLAMGYALEAAYVATGGPPREARALALIARAHDAALRAGTPETRAITLLARMIVDFMNGRFPETVVDSDETMTFAAASPGAAWDLRTARIVAAWSCFFSGQLRQLTSRVHAYLRESDASGDRYSSMQLRLGVNNAAWLTVDDVAGALRAIDDARASWPAEDAQNLHYYGCIATTNALLYRGDDDAAAAAVATAWPLVERSLMMQVPFVTIAMREARARATLAVASRAPAGRDRVRLLASAARDARAIRRLRQPFGGALASLLEAGVAQLGDDRDGARRLLTAAADDPLAMGVVATVARYALARLAGDDEQVASAALAAEGVVRPARLARVVAPACFPPPEPAP